MNLTEQIGVKSDARLKDLYWHQFALDKKKKEKRILYIVVLIYLTNQRDITKRLFSLQFRLRLDDGLHSGVHFLDGFDFRQSQASLVGNIIDSTHGLGVLSVDA